VLGIIGLAVAFLTDTAPSGTHNLGLLQQQMMGLHFGLSMLLIGAVLAGASAIVDQLSRGAGETAPAVQRHDDSFSTLSEEAHRKRILWTVGVFTIVALVIVGLVSGS
jgi:hypothetical protein